MLFYFDCIHKSRDCAMSSTIFKLLQFKVNVEIKSYTDLAPHPRPVSPSKNS